MKGKHGCASLCTYKRSAIFAKCNAEFVPIFETSKNRGFERSRHKAERGGWAVGIHV